MFLQSLLTDHSLYVFPPFALVIAPLLKCSIPEQDFHGALTIIILEWKPRRFWWALQRSDANASFTMKSVFPREASDLVTPVVHPHNLDATV